MIVSGGNYGWNVKEGSGCFDPANPDASPATCPGADAGGRPLRDPVLEFLNARQPGGLGLAVVGGHVYRGVALPQLSAKYVFGTWSAAQAAPDGRIFVATPQAGAAWPFAEAVIAGTPDGRLGRFLRGFGEDAAGELYALTGDTPGPTGATGKVFRLVP